MNSMKALVILKDEKRERPTDNEALHIRYDQAIESRLRELDPAYLRKVKRVVSKTDFWYA